MGAKRSIASRRSFADAQDDSKAAFCCYPERRLPECRIKAERFLVFIDNPVSWEGAGVGVQAVLNFRENHVFSQALPRSTPPQ
jgi:hypothetical protein